ncbi:unnamed protein product [Laminaria digitata]
MLSNVAYFFFGCHRLWWPHTAKQEGDNIGKNVSVNIWKKRIERPNVVGVCIRSRTGAPSRKGHVINGQMT